MTDKIKPDKWICEHCNKCAYGLEWHGWIQLPKDWFMCKVTLPDGQEYHAAACSDACMRKVDETFAEHSKGDA